MAADLNWLCQCLLYPRMKLMHLWNWPEKKKVFQLKIGPEILCDINYTTVENRQSALQRFRFFFLLSVGYHILCQTNVRYTQSQYFVVQWRGMPSIVRNRWITMIKVLNYIAVMHIMMQTKPNLWIQWFMPYSQWSVNLTTVCVMDCPTHL